MSLAQDTEMSVLMAAARDAVLAEADANPATPDFFESVQRAHELDPDVVSLEQLEIACELAEVVPMRATAPEPGSIDPEFGAFLVDVVRQRNGVAEQRRLGSIPATPGVGPGRSGRRLGLSLLAAAAVVAMALGLGNLVQTAENTRGADQSSQAVHGEDLEPTASTAKKRQPKRTAPRAFAPAPSELPAPEVELPSTDPDVVVNPVRPEPEEASKNPKESRNERLERLDLEAQARWRAGDLAGAEAKFRELIRRAPKGDWVELAYGDLFALARQAHGAEHEKRLWDEYLRKYPRGRHADDARAGLCRRTQTGDARNTCWTDYLADFPRGAHRKQASAAAPSASQ